MKKFLFIFSLFISASLFQSCTKSSEPDPILPIQDTTSLPISSPLKETFESGTKIDYASSSISLNSGKWNFTDAVVGNSTDDKKNGSKSVRIRNTGKISMNFDVINGVYTLVVAHAMFGTDQSSSWQLWASYNSGGSYSQIGNTITTSSAILVTDTFTVNSPGKVRFSFRKTSADNNQLNIDDVELLRTANPQPAGSSDNDNLLMGNPSAATPSVITEDNFFMNKGYYCLSYNRSEGKPNWVSWHLDSSDLGSASRQPTFVEDTALPYAWYHVISANYTGSGFDRGHNCPSADRTISDAANYSTFYMTNIIPQAPMLNQLAWARLEDSCRNLIFSGKELYIINGSFGSGGTGTNGYANTINDGNVVVPQYVWKVVVVLSNGNNDLSRVSSTSRVIAVWAPNDEAASTNWKDFRVSVDNIEAQTGYDLLSNLPVNIQQVIEAQVDNL